MLRMYNSMFSCALLFPLGWIKYYVILPQPVHHHHSYGCIASWLSHAKFLFPDVVLYLLQPGCLYRVLCSFCLSESHSFNSPLQLSLFSTQSDIWNERWVGAVLFCDLGFVLLRFSHSAPPSNFATLHEQNWPTAIVVGKLTVHGSFLMK